MYLGVSRTRTRGLPLNNSRDRSGSCSTTILVAKYYSYEGLPLGFSQDRRLSPLYQNTSVMHFQVPSPYLSSGRELHGLRFTLNRANSTPFDLRFVSHTHSTGRSLSSLSAHEDPLDQWSFTIPSQARSMVTSALWAKLNDILCRR